MLTGEHIVILLGLAVGRNDDQVAAALRISVDRVRRAQRVAALSGVYHLRDRRVLVSVLFRALHDAGRVVYPAVELGTGRGVVTGLDAVSALDHAVDGLRLVGNVNRRIAVWPDPRGAQVGRRIAPLHKNCPNLASNDEAWYRLVALTDALRLGPVRESARALEILQQVAGAA
jgi:hypothetical protein